VEPHVSAATSNEFLADMPWGSHVCHIYTAQEDLLEIIVPFLAAGLASNERCLWSVTDPLTVDEAMRALREAVPDLDRHVERGSIEIRRHDEWYLSGGAFEPHAMANAWKPALAQALADGYQGLRGTGSTSWVPRSDWESFAEYERQLDESITGHPLKILCSYSLPACGPLELLEAARTHPLAMARRDGGYKIIATAHGRRTDPLAAGNGEKAIDEIVPEGEWRKRERANILSAMRRSKGRIYGRGGAAELLALKPSTLQSRIRAFGIRADEARSDN
jgi:hypothetical protein